jgi:hypothetical protein
MKFIPVIERNFNLKGLMYYILLFIIYVLIYILIKELLFTNIFYCDSNDSIYDYLVENKPENNSNNKVVDHSPGLFLKYKEKLKIKFFIFKESLKKALANPMDDLRKSREKANSDFINSLNKDAV